MTKGAIIFRLAVCTVVCEIFFIICMGSLIPRQMPNVFVFVASLISVLATAVFFIPGFKAEWRGQRAKSFQNIFWICVSINVVIMWWWTIAMLALTDDDGGFAPHPVMERAMDAMLFPLIYLPGFDKDNSITVIGPILNCLLWGFAIVYGCRFIIYKIKTRNVPEQQ